MRWACVEQAGRLGVDDAAIVVGLHRQLVRLQVSEHHVVFPAGEGDRRTRIALAAGAAAQLIVEPLGVVASGADHVQAAEFGDRRRAERLSSDPPSRMSVPRPAIWVDTVTDPSVACLGDDGGFLGVVLRVEHDGRDAGLDESLVQLLGLGDIAGADQDRLAGLVHLGDVLDDRVVLGCRGDIDAIGLVLANVGSIRRNW